MTEEFVDLYQVLELPVDADRNTVRKRVNELYIDAQRNLDHRHFPTRVKFQELFEVTLPQARYILLDDGRRDEYDRLVHAFRGAQAGGPPVPPGQASASSTKNQKPGAASGENSLGRPELADLPILGERAPAIEPLPQAETDPVQLAQEREELWKKWKVGLEAALTSEGEKPKSRAAATASPTSFTGVAPPEAAAGSARSAAPAVSDSAPRPPARPKIPGSFDAPEKQAGFSALAPPDVQNAPAPSPAEIEARRAQHRRQLMKEVLVNVSLIWGVIGAAIVVVPGLIALIAVAGHFYPRGEAALIAFPSQALWGVGLLLIGVAAFFASRALSGNQSQKKATELSLLSYEELLKQIGKS